MFGVGGEEIAELRGAEKLKMLKVATLAACAAVAFGHGRSTFDAEVRVQVGRSPDSMLGPRLPMTHAQEFPLVARPAARGVKMTFGVGLPHQK